MTLEVLYNLELTVSQSQEVVHEMSFEEALLFSLNE